MEIQEQTIVDPSSVFDPSSVVAKVLIDINGNIEVEPEKPAIRPSEGSDLRAFGGRAQTRVLWYDVYKKNPTIIRFYYITSAGDKKYVDIEIP
jgi:hypothetical protein